MVTSQEELGHLLNWQNPVSWKLIAFYLGVPLAIGLYGAINNWEIQQSIGYSGTLVFYLSHSIVPWWITCLSTYGLMKLFTRWQPRPLVLMVLGAFLGCMVSMPYTVWITNLFEQAWPTQSFDGFITHVLSADFFIFYLRVVLIWIAVNFLFDRYIGLPRYRYHPARPKNSQPVSASASTDSISSSEQPAFLARLPKAVTAQEILAISAEQHYIKVHTADKEHLILYRFSDAINEIGPGSGMQVHRSWWVAKAAIASLHRGTKKFYLRLETGQKVPVSTPYQGMLREFAKAESIPLKPAATSNS